MNGMTVSNINRAIINGEKKGVFLLPKGASGKVKLAKAATDNKEVSTAHRRDMWPSPDLLTEQCPFDQVGEAPPGRGQEQC